jgi:hypothetical protein
MAHYSMPTAEEMTGCSAWCEPIHKVERAIAGQPFGRFCRSEDFMCMGKVHRSSRPDLILNKHRATRRYLNLDSEGHAYRYVPPKDPNSLAEGSYRKYGNLVDAIDELDLYLLPWFYASGFEDENLGLTYDQRFDHPDVIAWYARREEARARTGRRR